MEEDKKKTNNKNKWIGFAVIILAVVVSVIVIGIVISPPTKNIDEEVNDLDVVGYIEITGLGKDCKISNKEIISEIMRELKNIQIEEIHPYKKFIEGFNLKNIYSSMKSGYTIKAYESKNKVDNLFEVDIVSMKLR